jgi:hypothetical protein
MSAMPIPLSRTSSLAHSAKRDSLAADDALAAAAAAVAAAIAAAPAASTTAATAAASGAQARCGSIDVARRLGGELAKQLGPFRHADHRPVD